MRTSTLALTSIHRRFGAAVHDIEIAAGMDEDTFRQILAAP